MESDLISVIIPVYNTEQYIAACLDSVLTQSHRNMEVIVVNDGSTDYSLQIAEKYAENDDRVKVYTQNNKGQAEARNHGLEVATGDYITFVDSDDMLLPKSLEVMIKFMELKGVDIIEGKLIEGIEHKQINYVKNLSSEIFDSLQAIEFILYQRKGLPSPCGKIYRKELFDGLRFTNGIIYEDLDLFYKVYERADKIALINYPVYFYRINEESTTHTWKPERLDVLKVTEDLENYISQKYPHLIEAARDRRLSANFNMFALCSIHGNKENALKCWEIIKKYRKKSLLNPKVRIKNKAGILLSYFGKHIFNLAAGRLYK